MGKKIAVCIGINNYPGTENDLSGCLNDVKDWSALLSKNGYSVTRLTDARATRQNILDALQKAVGNAVNGDSVFVMYSGHGSFVDDNNGDEPDGTDECLCPYDIDRNGEITDDDLYEIFASRIKGVRLVMVSDSCHSGTLIRFKPGMGKKKKTKRVKFLPPENFLSRKTISKLGVRLKSTSQPPGHNASLLMAGCQDAEYSYDAEINGRPNGAFTYAAMEAFKAMRTNSNYYDWFKAIRDMLPTQEYPQTPKFFGTRLMRKWKIFS